MKTWTRLLVEGALFCGLLLSLGLAAQEEPTPDKEEKSESLTKGLPQRELSKEELRKRQEKLQEELQETYKKWLEEDVVYIIIPEEKEAFLGLQTDEGREAFIEQFWLRRDPTPQTVENEFREEHYRRIAYANEHFSSGYPGWLTDRGRIYIAWGPPDEMESHPGAGPYHRPYSEGGGTTAAYPFEIWRYRYLEGIGQDVVLEFVDDTMSGEYRLTMDPSDKDALLYVPNAGLTTLEAMGLASKRDRFNRTDGTRQPTTFAELGSGTPGRGNSFAFDRLQQYVGVLRPPDVKFKDLETLVNTRVSYNLLPFAVRFDFFRVTESTILVPVTVAVRKKDLTFQQSEGLHKATVNVFGRISTLSGRLVQTFEDVIQLDIPPSLFEQALDECAVYQKVVPLRPGLYKFAVVMKDIYAGNIGTLEKRLAVPRFEEEKLAHSSLVLADKIQRVSSKKIGGASFVLGDTLIRPVVEEVFKSTDRMGIYFQIYNLGVDQRTHRPKATIDYTIRHRDDDKVVFSYTETTDDLQRAGRQITIEKVLPLISFEPGKYTLNVQITDHIRQQAISPATDFRISD